MITKWNLKVFNYKKVAIFFLAALCCATLRAQDSKSPLFGKVLDSLGNEVPYASLQLMANNKKVMADEKGRFDFGSISFPDTLAVISDYYQSEKTYLAEPAASKDSLFVRLKFFFKLLYPIEVTAKYNLDSILRAAFQKFKTNFVDFEADVFLRAVQQHGKIYTGVLEAIGNYYFYINSFDYFSNYGIFNNARSTGFQDAWLFAQTRYHFTAKNLQASLPWQAEWYNKSNVKISNQAGLLAITLTPKSEFKKELEDFDEKAYLSLPLFPDMVRTYIIDLKNSNLVSIDLKSSAAARSKYDQNKRNYVMRRYYFKFTDSGQGTYLDYAKNDFYLTAPKGKSGVWRFINDMYFSNQCQKKLNDNELKEKYNVSIDKKELKRRGRTVLWQGDNTSLSHDRFCDLTYKNFNGTFNRTDWEKKYIPRFLDRKKLFEDLKDNPHIGDFISKNEIKYFSFPP